MSLGGASGYRNFAEPTQGGGGKGGANLPSLIEQPLPQFTGDDPYSQIMAMTPAFRNPYANFVPGTALGGFDPNIYARGMQGGAGEGGDGEGSGGIGNVGGGVGSIGSDMSAEPAPSPIYDYAEPAPSPIYDYVETEPEPFEPDNSGFYNSEFNTSRDIDDASISEGVRNSDFIPANPSDFGVVDNLQPVDMPATGGDFRGEMGGDLGGDDGQDMGEDSFDTAGYAKGGMIRGLLGPNPKGPDDGFAMVQRGEYVIKKSAVNKYGRGLLDMINEGKVPAKKIKSLLD